MNTSTSLSQSLLAFKCSSKYTSLLCFRFRDLGQFEFLAHTSTLWSPNEPHPIADVPVSKASWIFILAVTCLLIKLQSVCLFVRKHFFKLRSPNCSLQWVADRLKLM